MENSRPLSFIVCCILIYVNLVNLVPVTGYCEVYSTLVYRTERYCFALMDRSETWQDAESACRRRGAALAKMDEHILTNTTASAIANAFKIRKDVSAHVGFRRLSNALVWLQDGSKVTIPDVDSLSNGTKGMLLIDNRGDSVKYFWFLYPADHKLPYICQFDLRPIKVRLVNGPSPTAGRVEVYYNNTWGTVCDEYWDKRDAQVVCRMLGFLTDEADVCNSAFYGKGTERIHLSNVYCLGNETSLQHCYHRGWGVVDCDHSNDAGVACPEVRLVNGTSSTAGRVEVYYNNTWGTVCEDEWDNLDAQVVCRMLGLPRVEAEVRKNGFFGTGIGPIFLSNVKCRGNETNLRECSHSGWGVDNCGHSQGAGVVCPEVRLVNGTNPRAGRVEVYYNNAWGTVCADDDWNNREARVICRMLGFPTDGAVVRSSSFFGEGTGPIHLSNVYCGSHHTNLRHCSHSGWGVAGCNHSEDGGVACMDLQQMKIRLVNTPSPWAGRVEVYHDNVWATVCSYHWDKWDAQVVCRMLGFPTDKAVAHRYAVFGAGTGLIGLSDFRCRGNETSLRQCPHEGWGIYNCGHRHDVGVVCPDEVTSICDMHSEMVYRTERYCFALMNPSTSWGDAEEKCRHLGAVLAKMDEHILTDATVTAIANAFNIHKGERVHLHVGFSKTPGVEAVWLLDGSKVTIPGVSWWTEGDGILVIDHRGDSIDSVWVVYPTFKIFPFICQFDTHPLKVRLVNGTNSREGRVEVSLFNVWGTVCDDDWDSPDAMVVCRMLGFSADGAVARSGSFFGDGIGQTVLDHVTCGGTEASLQDCYMYHRGWGVVDCSKNAGVVCQDIPVFTTTAGLVGETTDATIYGTTAVSTYVNVEISVISDTPRMSTTTSAADGTVGDELDITTVDNRDTTVGDRKPIRIKRRQRPTRVNKVVAMTGESVYMDGQALLERRSAMVTMCSRTCTSDDRCARFNYNQVTGDCRIFSEDAEVSYKTKPDWTVWETIVTPQK